MISILLNAGGDRNAVDLYKRPLLHLAALSGTIGVVKILVSLGADVNAKTDSGSTPLMMAAQGSSPDVGDILLKAGAQINIQDKEINYTALHWAAMRGNLEFVQLLLDNGADVNLKGFKEETALNLARLWRQDAVVEVLESFMKEKG